jgi:Flp pilus assembly protein TadG
MVGRERVGRDRGQAAVELALALPVVVAVTLGLVQVLAVAADQLAVELAAREGARAAAVAADPSAAAANAARAAVPLDPLGVSATTAAGRVTVTVTYTSRTDVPLIGALIGDVELRADVTMAVEPP